MNSTGSAVVEACEFVAARQHIEVESTATCKKRASVAILIAYHIPSPDSSPSSSWINVNHDEHSTAPQSADVPSVSSLKEFEKLPFVQHGEPHVLFIKRAAREGDRWASHVALPGGKRESDESDIDAARRETEEEVGITLEETNSLYVGGLDQRMVTTSFGSRELLVLCPYIWLWTRPGLPRPVPQESEVQSAHWVSLKHLLDPSSRTREQVDISSRLAQSYARGSFFATCIKFVTGSMLFSAIDMTATQSIRASSSTSSIRVGSDDLSDKDEARPELIMWGLTLSVMTDFLDLLPPHSAISLWQYPTFSAPDLALILSWLNKPSKEKTQKLRSIRPRSEKRLLRDQRRAERRAERAEKKAVADAEYAQTVSEAVHEETGSMDYVGIAMMDFYAKIRPAIAITIGVRAGVAGIGLLIALRQYRKHYA